MGKTTAQTPQLATQPPGDLVFFRLLLPVFLAVRLIYAGKLLLIPDEAFYWVLSRHLAPGYLDHPPMIALVIWLGTRLLGSIEMGVRLVGVLMSVAALAIIVALAGKVLHNRRAMVWVAIIWLTSPLLAAWGTIMTPDTPVMFFSLCALAFVALIADRDDRAADAQTPVPSNPGLWLLFGLFSGLAMVSKYTGILLPTAIALAMLFSPQGRHHYRQPWIYLSGIVAVLVFSPVIWWNATHGWASFLFQLHHGTGIHHVAEQSTKGPVQLFFNDIFNYLGGQLLIWTPVLFGIVVTVLVGYWLRFLAPVLKVSAWAKTARGQQFVERLQAKPRLTLVDQVMLWSATLPLILFGIAALRSHHTEANWPGFAYFPASLLVARWLSENWSGARLKWAHLGVRVAIVGLVAMHILLYPTVTRRLVQLPYHIPHGLQDFNGWRQFGTWLGMESGSTGAPVFTNRHQDAGEASFYMPGQPEVWCVSIGTRPTAFDYFDEQPDFAKIPRLIWVGGNYDLFKKAYGYTELAQFSAMIVPARYERANNMREYKAFLLTKTPR
jgi:4-amino-4-deoxy-L-arabinose transferase-like glycosyltransferase